MRIDRRRLHADRPGGSRLRIRGCLGERQVERPAQREAEADFSDGAVMEFHSEGCF